MATANWQTDQPTNLNYLSPVNFDLQINKLPQTKYFCTGVTLPGVVFSEALHSLPLAINSYLPGDKIEFDPLNVKFLVDEDMKNYMEIFNWIMALGPGSDEGDFQNLTGSSKNTSGQFSNSDFSKMYSDATLFANTSSNNANVEFQFQDCFPTSVGTLAYTQNATDVDYLTTDVIFKYKLYEIVKL